MRPLCKATRIPTIDCVGSPGWNIPVAAKEAETLVREAPPTISAAQCRAGRALIEMDQGQLARRSVVSTDAIADFENGSRTPIESSLAAIRAALEFAGVIFIDGEEPGVKLRKRRK